jgi:hypothetical protein
MLYVFGLLKYWLLLILSLEPISVLLALESYIRLVVSRHKSNDVGYVNLIWFVFLPLLLIL